MFVKINIDGSIQSVIRPRIFKGSHKIHNLKLLAPLSSDHIVVFKIKLPNENRYGDYMEFEQAIENYNCWTFPINSTMTAIEGIVEVSFDISLDDKVITTAKTHFFVEDSVLIGDDYEETVLSFHNLLQLVNDKISRTELEDILSEYNKGNLDVWTGNILPPINYNTWFKPVSHNENEIELGLEAGNEIGKELNISSFDPPTGEELNLIPIAPPIGDEIYIRLEEPASGEEVDLTQKDPPTGEEIEL